MATPWQDVQMHATDAPAPLEASTLARLAGHVYDRLRSDCALPAFTYDISAATLSSGVLATASTNFALVNGVWTPTALAGGAGLDFIVRVQETPPNNWWTGSCADLPPYHFDLQTTLLHEMLHGLGILSLVGADGHMYWGGTSPFDAALRDANGTAAVVNSTFLPAFGDPVTVAGIPIYNPAVFSPGSSLSHYDAVGVMAYAQPWSACVRSLDNASRALLRAVGYDCAPGPPAPAPEPLDVYVLVVVAGVLLVAGAVAACWCSGRAEPKRGKRFAV